MSDTHPGTVVVLVSAEEPAVAPSSGVAAFLLKSQVSPRTLRDLWTAIRAEAGTARSASQELRDEAQALKGQAEHQRRRAELIRRTSVREVSLSAASPRTSERRMSALQQANEVRSARAKLKRDLREGKVCLEQVLAAPPAYLATAKVVELLVAVPKIGPARAARMLTTARVSQMKTIVELSARQRACLIELLSGPPVEPGPSVP